MTIKLTGYLLIERLIDGELVEETILAEDFSLEEDGIRRFDDGEIRYEALYVYKMDNSDDSIQFEAVNTNGNVEFFPFEICGKIEILEDNFTGSSNSDSDRYY